MTLFRNVGNAALKAGILVGHEEFRDGLRGILRKSLAKVYKGE